VHPKDVGAVLVSVDQPDPLRQVIPLLERMLRENAAAFDMLGLIAMMLAESTPRGAARLRTHLSTLANQESDSLTEEFLALCRRMSCSLAPLDIELLSRTPAAKSASSKTEDLMKQLRARGNPTDGVDPPDE
jgi:hypothetical protein